MKVSHKERLECHYKYEQDMLVATFEALEKDVCKAVKNALKESFCVHARNIIEFYKKNKNGLCYAEQSYKPFYGKELEVKNVNRKVNNEVSHLIHDERTCNDSKKLSDPDRLFLLCAISEETHVFKACLKPKYAAFVIQTLPLVHGSATLGPAGPPTQPGPTTGPTGALG